MAQLAAIAALGLIVAGPGCASPDPDDTGGGGTGSATSTSTGQVDPADRCERAGGQPIVTIGEGLGDYLPIDDGETMQVEQGPQGGYHVWVATRVRGLKQSGSITRVRGRFPDLDYDVEELAVVFTMEPDEGDYCKLYGLRFRIDDPTHPVASLLDQQLDLTVEITDRDGDVGRGERSARTSASFR